MVIANDYNPNFDFCTSQDWLDWINKQPIMLGQPCLKEDKKSRLLQLDYRINRLCLVQPANRRFNSSIRRMYLPRSAEQFMDFLGSRKIYIDLSTIEPNIYRVKCKCINFEETDKGIFRIFGKLLSALKNAKKLK